ncbi:MAG: hypothetical protein D6784_09980 [Chloroflexi bacterium]|nr:MAG: hypothetical protein D6784_09980 [Chloroflexota bacterium]
MLDTFGLLEADYIETGKVRFVIHPYYLGNPAMGLATEAALCAHDQGKFFEYEHLLYEKQGQIDYSPQSLVSLAGEVGLKQDTFSQCLRDRKYQDYLENARRAASNRGVKATPTFFINNRRVEGNQPYEVFKSLIEQELKLAQ